MHLRYEDDYYAQISPFAFGIIIDQIHSFSSSTEWHFSSLDKMQFIRSAPKFYF